MSNKLAKMSSLQRDNLLINSDFKSGIINQKGIISLDKGNGETELTVDGWISYGINCSVSSNFVTFANRTSTMHTVKQPIKINASTKLTVYINAITVTGNIYVYLDGYEGQKKKINSGDNIFVFSLSSYVPKSFIIEFDPNATISINRIKLEYGDCYTGMPAWNYTLELLKCQRYFLSIFVKAHNNSGSAGNKYFSIDTMFPTYMNKTPTVTIKKAYLVDSTDITSSVINSQVLYGNKNVGYIIFPMNRYDYMVKLDLWFDAYDY